MIDHILKFDSEVAAKSALADYVIEDTWDGSRTIPDLKIITQEAAWDHSDPENPVLVSPEQTLPGFWIAVALLELATALRDLPDNACRFIANRDTGGFIYTAPDINAGLLATARVAPVFAGSGYSFT